MDTFYSPRPHFPAQQSLRSERFASINARQGAFFDYALHLHAFVVICIYPHKKERLP